VKCGQSSDLTYILPVLKTIPMPYMNFTSGYDLDHESSAVCDFASAYQISAKLGHIRMSYDIISISKMAAAASEICRFPVW